jgi:hypothetical protein
MKKQDITIVKPSSSTSKISKIDKREDKYIQQLAFRIRSIRKSLGYSNADFFAYENNFSRSQYGRYELSEDIRYSSLRKLVKAFNMTMTEFFSVGFDD